MLPRDSLVVCVLVLCARAAEGIEFYSYGPAYDSQLPRQNDVSSLEISLAVPIKFFGETYSSVFVSFLIKFVQILLKVCMVSFLLFLYLSGVSFVE